MGFYRLAGALILTVSGCFGAYLMNKAASVMLRQADGWLALLRYVKVQVECFALPMSAIFARIDGTLIQNCGYVGDRPPQNFEELFWGCHLRDGETAQILQGFVDAFGKSYREEQAKECAYYCALLSERRERVAAQLPTKRKLNSTLCIAGALAVVILLI